MKQWTKRMSVLFILGLILPVITRATTQIGFVNVAQLFDQSTFVRDTNKKLREDAQQMNIQLEQQRNKLRQLIEQYHAAKTDAAKKKLDSPLKTENLVLQNLKNSFQQKMHDDEVAGKRHFDQLLHIATERVAKTNHINAIVTEQSVLYSDNSWINLTKDVTVELQKVTAEDAHR